MNECEKYKRLFEKALNGELANQKEKLFNNHLSSCKDCLKEFKELFAVMHLINDQYRPEPDEDFMYNFWETLEPKLEKKRGLFPYLFEGFESMVRFIYSRKYQIAAGMALLLLGIFIGKFLNEGRKTTTQFKNADKYNSGSKQTELKVEATNYIERSKVLLLGIMNYDPSNDDAETISLSHQKNISRELLTQATVLKTELKNPSQQQMKNLVSDIELVLLQIADLETGYGLSGIELIKKGVSSRGLLLKINIEEMREIKNGGNQWKNQSKNGNKKYNSEI